MEFEKLMRFMRLGALVFVLLCCASLALQESLHAGSHFFDLCVAFGAVIFSVAPLFALMGLFQQFNKLDQAKSLSHPSL